MNTDNLLNFYANKWHFTDSNLIEKTSTSEIYKVTKNNSTYVLKILNEVGRRDEGNGV